MKVTLGTGWQRGTESIILSLLPPKVHSICPLAEGLQARLEDPVYGLGPKESFYCHNPQV